MIELEEFSSPFIEERLYFFISSNDFTTIVVLVPFYRGAVVFITERENMESSQICSRPLLSRSGCIYAMKLFLDNNFSIVLVPFYRGAVVFYFKQRKRD